MRRFMSLTSVFELLLLILLSTAGNVAAKDDPNPPPIDETIGFNLPGVDGEEAAVRAALVRLRKGQVEGVSDQELGHRKLKLMKAEQAYRSALARAIYGRTQEVRSVNQLSFKAELYKKKISDEERNHRWHEFLSKFPGSQYSRAKSARKRADEMSAIRLKTYLDKTPNFIERWTGLGASGLDTAIKARIEAQLRLARLWESAAFEVLSINKPVVCINLPDSVPLPGSLAERFNGRCTSQTIYRLAELSERIAASFPASYVRTKGERDADLRTDLVKEMAGIRNRLDMEEYRRLALTGLVVDPETNVPVGGILRIRVAEQAEKALVQYLDRVGRLGEFRKLWSSEPLRDLGKSLVEKIKYRPDYKILHYLETGETPTPKHFFLIVANVIRTEQEALVSVYRDGYLGGKWDQVDLEQLMRVANLYGDGDDNIEEVKERLNRFIKEMDTAHDALLNARKMSPEQLEQDKPRHYQLMRQMGYIDIPDNDQKRARYVIPETARSFRSFAERASNNVDIPGKGILAAVNLRTAGQAAISAILPELAGAQFAAYGRNVFVSERAYAAATLAGEAIAGTLLDASMESFFNRRDARPGQKIKGVEWDRLILESMILGTVTQFTGGVVDEAFDVTLKTLGSKTPNSALYKAIKKHPLMAKHVEAYARTALGLASETSLTTFFQMYVQGNMDETSWQAVLINSALSRAVAKGVNLAESPKVTWQEIKRYLPKESRPVFDANPRLIAETRENINRQREEARKTLKDFQERTAGEIITSKRLFRELAQGELSWRNLTKVIYPAMKDRLRGPMESLRVMRKRSFDKMKRKAIKRSIRDINRFFDLLTIKANNKSKTKTELTTKLKKIEARREAELQLVRKKIIAPGSQDPTSDIDRSSRSQWVRRHLRAIYDAEIRLSRVGDGPSSARAFDVNEYINVMPFISETGQYMSAMRSFTAKEGPGNLGHSVAMEALSLAAVMRFMSAPERLIFLDNKRAALKAEIDAGQAMAVDSGRLERQIEFAMNSIAKAEKVFQIERAEVAKRKPGLRDSEIDLLATDAIYDRKMAKISNKQFELSLIENQNSPEALGLRAEIMRDMADGLRSGIETYSSPVGIDIIVSRIQGAKRPDGSKKKVADRLEEAGFTLKGELSDFSSHDIKAMINDQLMFITEHVHGFSSGHEGAYETGRALGKYIERAFLGMKILGLDIGEVRRRPEYDPHRRLLEAAQSLAAVKDNPEALLERLKDFSRTSPPSYESGMAEIFWLIEKVLPGMKNLTGVSADAPPIKATSAAESRQLDATYRRARMIARLHWRDELTLVRETLGPEHAIKLVSTDIAGTKAKIASINQRMAAMAKLGEDYQSKDWGVVSRLQNALYEVRVLAANLTDPKAPLLKEIHKQKKAVEAQLESLRRPLLQEMIKHRLYASGAGYRRLANRRMYLRERLQWLQDDLGREKQGAEKARQLMKFDLTGRWMCESASLSDISAAVSVNENRVTMELKIPAPLSISAKLDAVRRWGIIKGVWQVPVDTAIGAAIGAAGLIEARSSDDGKEIHFTTGSTGDPMLPLNWSSLVCRSDQRGKKSAPDKPFLYPTYVPQHDDSEFTPNWSIKVNGAEDNTLLLPIRIRRGRKVYYDTIRGTPNSKLEPGRYQAAITLAGRTITQPIEIKPGMITNINVHPATVRLTGIPADDSEVKFRLHLAGERKRGLPRFRAGTKIPVVPGSYDLELSTILGSTWITGLDLKPGQVLDVKTRTGTLTFQGTPGSNLRFRRAQVEGAGERTWLGVFPGEQPNQIPPGNYDLAWEEGGKTQQRQIRVKPGQETHVDLR